MADRTAATGHVVADADSIAEVRRRLARAQGQIGGVLRMLDEGRSCQEVVTQLAAANKAIDRAAFLLIATGLQECLRDGGTDADEVVAQLQKLFLTMA